MNTGLGVRRVAGRRGRRQGVSWSRGNGFLGFSRLAGPFSLTSLSGAPSQPCTGRSAQLPLCYGQRSPLGAKTLSQTSLQMTFLPTDLVPRPRASGQVTRQTRSSLRNAAVRDVTGSSTRRWGARAGVPGRGDEGG